MSPTPLRVLIVDDQADSAKMLRALLKLKGFAARVELDGEAALAAAPEFLPQVALLDLTLPGMSGLELAAALRLLPETAGCTLVAVTGHGEDTLPSPSPFDRHFLKPLDLDALTDYLNGLGPGASARSQSALA